MYRWNFTMELILLLELTLFLCTSFVQTTVRDDALEELNKIILKEIQLKREAMEILEDDTKKIGISRNDISKVGVSRSGIPLSLSNRIDSRRDVVNNAASLKKSGYNAIEKKEVSDALLKRSIRDAILKKDITDALVNILYDKLKRKRETDMKDVYQSDIDGVFNTMDSDKDIRPTKGVGKDPPGLWGRDEVRRPPGLWGKRDEKMRDTVTHPHKGPPGLWGREISTHNQVSMEDPPGKWRMGRWGRREENGKRLLDIPRLSDNQPDLWRRKVEKKTTKGNTGNILT